MTLLSRRPSSPREPLTLDLTSLPPAASPPTPTNTLLITNLQDLDTFRPDNLQSIRSLIDATAPTRTWAPLKSFRRIVASFPDAESASRVRAAWDGEAVMGHRARVYYGQHTPDRPADDRLELPDAGKLFFISPPPSPPHGWEVRLEDAPNKLVHADDLAAALSKLHHRPEAPISPAESQGQGRSRSSTLIYQPSDHGGDEELPTIAVEDMTDEPESYEAGQGEKKVVTHTARPPVELMHDA